MIDGEDGITRTKFSALCPHCQAPHQYVEVTQPVDNDPGFWEVRCASCQGEFVIELENPNDSYGSFNKRIARRVDEPYSGAPYPVAREIRAYEGDRNANVWRFNYSSAVLYRCKESDADLDGAAKLALDAEISDIRQQYSNAVNNLLKGGGDHKFVIARLALPCLCGKHHTANYYAPLTLDPWKDPPDTDAWLLADVSGSNLEETLDGIVSKTDAMDLLEKLIIRWNLLADQIPIVSPFVGYQQHSDEQLLEIWHWLLPILDGAKSIVLTRGPALAAYKKAMEGIGESVAELERFGLENKIVAMDMRKHNFHAKFFAGMSERGCEVLSGSANLVRGPSMENISFKAMSKEAFEARYVQRLNLKKSLPEPPSRARRWVLIERRVGSWISTGMVDKAYLAGA